MRVKLISVPVAGASTGPEGHFAGLALAADAYLEAGLRGRLEEIEVDVRGSARPLLSDVRQSQDPIVNLGRYNALVAQAVVESLAEGAHPLLAGGTCAHLIGMLAGLQRSFGPLSRIGLIWLDAHGDFNTPQTSISGMLGGMPVAVSAGLCLAPWRELAGMTGPLPTDRIVFVDVRNLDAKEADLIEATDATIVKFGPDNDTNAIASEIHRLAERVDHFYLHVDADILDASLQPNHPTAEPNGPGLAAVHTVLRTAFATGKVRAFAVVSVNPSGPGGETSLRSGMRLILDGVSAWSEFATDL